MVSPPSSLSPTAVLTRFVAATAASLQGPRYILNYEEVAAGIEDERILAVRVEKEETAAALFQSQTRTQFHCMRSLHRWLFAQHLAYSTRRYDPLAAASKHGTTISNEQEALLLKSY
jgi:hypothetical protein